MTVTNINYAARRDAVALLRMPAEAARRRRCAAAGELRVLVVSGDAPATTCLDWREDWVREPVTEADLRARVEGLRLRVRQVPATSSPRRGGNGAPRVDECRNLWFDDGWVVLSPAQARIAGCLAGRFGRLTTRRMLRGCLGDGVVASDHNLNVHVTRLRPRVRQLGLDVRAVSGLGYVLSDVRRAA